jgi:folate-binding protein YgfZ
MLELFQGLFGAPAAWRAHPERGLLRVTGADRVRFLNGMLSADVAALREGGVASALQLDRKGHVLAEVEVIALAGEIWLYVLRAAETALAAALERHIIADDVLLESLSGVWSSVSIEGPGGAAAAVSLGAPELAPGSAQHAGELLWLWGGALVPEGVRALGPATAVAELCSRLALPQIGDADAEILRIEAGRPLLGVDTNERTFPQEARLERRAVSFEKGCYIGQEIVARIQSRGGVNRLLVKLSTDSEVSTGSEISVGGRSSGRVTSAAVSPVSGPLALGYVRADDAAPGTPVRIGSVAGVVLAG